MSHVRIMGLLPGLEAVGCWTVLSGASERRVQIEQNRLRSSLQELAQRQACSFGEHTQLSHPSV